MPTVRVRFAPSPTGYLHVGGARTALFNWLFARREKGTFILRIEDTDAARSSEDMVSGILEGLAWLGLDWDEGPYFQSERIAAYQKFARELLQAGKAYRCFCKPDELKARREQAQRDKQPTRYERTCRDIGEEEASRREETGEPFALRFAVPPGTTRVRDLVRGEVDIDHDTIEDFVLLRSDGLPTYHLGVVVDDIDMRITHVIRGEDHISNTPKQILLYQAWGAVPPAFAHLPLILGPDKKRLSKRHGATSVTEYRERGYLPQAMLNFLALLGWSPGSEDELFTRDELIGRFSLDRVGSGSPIFNVEKLDWFNSQHINLMPHEDLVPEVKKTLEEAGLWDPDFLEARRTWFLKAVDLLKPRARMMADFAVHGRPFFSDKIITDPAAAKKHLSRPGLARHLAALIDRWRSLEPGEFTHAGLEASLRAVTGELGLKASDLIHPVRVAVTGASVGPSLFDVLECVGKDRVIRRIEVVISSLEALSASP
jgi:glutamyl-tRNA synthetase